MMMARSFLLLMWREYKCFFKIAERKLGAKCAKKLRNRLADLAANYTAIITMPVFCCG